MPRTDANKKVPPVVLQAAGEDQMSHTIPCPFCGAECSADFVDIGVGEERCGPYCCDACHATELGPTEFFRLCCGEDLGLDGEEKRAGWRRGEKS